MAKGKSKKATKVAPEKPKQKQAVIKTSYECENCKDQCLSGINYIEQLKISKKGNGVACKK